MNSSASAGLVFFVPAGLLAIASAVKVMALRRDPTDVLLRAVTALLLVATAVFATAAPPVLKIINDLTGVSNAAAPLVYCILTGFSGSCLVLLIHWRGGPDENRTRRAAKATVIAYSSVCAGLLVLFALADAPVERLRDLDTYYASTPYMREMILLYLLAHTVAAVTMTILCWRWSREVSGTLRMGLATMVVGYLLNLLYDGLKYTAIVARWTGNDLDWLSTNVAFSVASFSAILIGVGFLIPPIAHTTRGTWTKWRRYRQLRPLWHTLRRAAPASSAHTVSRFVPLDQKLVQVEGEIADCILRLGPYLDDSTGRAVFEQAMAWRTDVRAAQLEADAAVLASAAAKDVPVGLHVPDGHSQWTIRSIEDGDLIRLSKVMDKSPVVRTIRWSATQSESATS
ncbi:hypothetical protein OG730_08290 [Streptomyces sp. NBC_01298]|uniref:MAB_1171c family putative transporter n=1 Tax=Streptomyces sp. NBC_01298 TaxID=2903817 RepID=UPI002E0EDFBA|nr:hypothetical protein OG730_08290 [Streptomyces sp. NBC_01298]